MQIADRPADPNSNSDDATGVPRAHGSAPRTPRWVQAFGIVALILIVLFAVQLILGGRHGPGMHAPSSDAAGPAAPSSTAEGDAGEGGPADPDDADRIVEVATLDSMAFEPSRIDVSAGETVTFIVSNTGQATHEFTLGDAAMQQEHADAMAHMPDGMAHDLPNSITLQAGETKQLTWRFADNGAFEYACHEPGHYQAGMRGQVTVG
jgi:uncharacterized cupredoxin-like copper-binding protein